MNSNFPEMVPTMAIHNPSWAATNTCLLAFSSVLIGSELNSIQVEPAVHAISNVQDLPVIYNFMVKQKIGTSSSTKG